MERQKVLGISQNKTISIQNGLDLDGASFRSPPGWIVPWNSHSCKKPAPCYCTWVNFKANPGKRVQEKEHSSDCLQILQISFYMNWNGRSHTSSRLSVSALCWRHPLQAEAAKTHARTHARAPTEQQHRAENKILSPLASTTDKCWAWAAMLAVVFWALCFKHTGVCSCLRHTLDLLLACCLFSKATQKVRDVFINHKGDTAGRSHSNQIGKDAFVKSTDAFFPTGGTDTGSFPKWPAWTDQQFMNTGHGISSPAPPYSHTGVCKPCAQCPGGDVIYVPFMELL